MNTFNFLLFLLAIIKVTTPGGEEVSSSEHTRIFKVLNQGAQLIKKNISLYLLEVGALYLVVQSVVLL